ncbi:glutamate decarboxylase [Escherichia coli]|nr:glutamate decarboxylase [Escherichia coli]
MKNKSGNSCYREAVNIHSSLELSFILHKYHLRVDEKKSRNVFSAIRDELILDGDSRQNLATFCQTWLDDEIRELLNLAIDKNMIYKDEYPQMAEPEGRCVRMLSDSWSFPDSRHTLGCSTIGSSEAAMLGRLALKWQWCKKREEQGKSTEPDLRSCANMLA